MQKAVRFGPTDILEKMLENTACHDVVFKLCDGEVSAHKAVLIEASPAFTSMLSGSMCEAASGKIEPPSADVASIRVFLRLIYTGHVNSKDWAGGDSEDPPDNIMLKVAELANKYLITHIYHDVIGAFKARLGAALLSPPLNIAGDPMDTWRVVSSQGFTTVRVREKPDRQSTLLSTKPINAIVHGWATGERNMIMAEEGWVNLAVEEGYMIISAQGGLQLQNPDIETFQTLFCSALKHHARPICTHAVLLAAKSAPVKRLFDQQSLNPEIQAELLALWETQIENPEIKRARLR